MNIKMRMRVFFVPQFFLAMVVISQSSCQRKNAPAIIAAATDGNTSLVQSLISQGADVNIEGPDNQTALIAVGANGNQSIAELLLDHGANIDAQSKYGETALIVAAGNGQLDLLRLLLSRGAKVNISSNEGTTALMIAAQDGYAYIVEALLSHGADPNLKNVNGSTALLTAASHGQLYIVRSLLKHGALHDDQVIEVICGGWNDSANSCPKDAIADLFTPRYSAEQLYSDYDANAVAADAKYKGRLVIVSGIIESIGKDMLGNPYVGLAGGNDGLVQCMADEDQIPTIAALSKGEHIKVRGKVAGKPITIVALENCSLVSDTTKTVNK